MKSVLIGLLIFPALAVFAVEGVEVQGPDLPFGDVNVVVLTDVHSWVGGHGPKEDIDADYGDVLSFYERLKVHCSSNNIDLFFAVNGDWIDGTGLATGGDPSNLVPLLEKMPWDVLNVGNHELYRNEVISYMTRPGGYVEWWGEKYLSSNIRVSGTGNPIGHQYRILHGRNSTVLTFGFLYNMKDHDTMVTVDEVESVVQMPWFKNVLRQNFDAILVLAHMGANDYLVDVLTEAIRDQVGESMPIQFITGHTHRRQTYRPDGASHSVEAGRYLDTIGFVSFPTIETVVSESNNSDLFQHVFIDASKKNMADTLGVEEMDTQNGKALSNFVQRTRRELGLLDVVGCVNQTYYLGESMDKPDSLWGLFANRIVPALYSSGKEVFFLGRFGWRYDLIKGDITLDDIMGVSPFNESFLVLEEVPGIVILQLNASVETVNDGTCVSGVPEYILAKAGGIDANETYHLISDIFEMSSIQRRVSDIDPSFTDVTPVPLEDGRTTSTIWVDYLRSKIDCATSTGQQGDVAKPVNEGAYHKRTMPDPRKDQFRLVFVSIAMLTVVLFAVVHIRGRDRIYQEYSSAQHELSLQALQEYEEEGRFV